MLNTIDFTAAAAAVATAVATAKVDGWKVFFFLQVETFQRLV